MTASYATSDPNTPAYRSDAYQRQRPFWDMMRHVLEGTPALRKHARKYAPKYELEDDKDYGVRIERTECFPAVKRTRRALAGMVFRRNPQLGKDADAELQADWENIDGAGTHGDVFARRLFGEALLTGLAGVLVDAPVAPPKATRGDEQRLGIRPYWCLVRAESILQARWETIGGKPVLVMLVLEEPVTRPSGRFGQTTVTQWRVYRRDLFGVTYEIWESPDGNEPALLDAGAITNQTEIPFAFLLVGDESLPSEVQPPLLDLAYSQIAHFNQRSDHRHSLHKANIPILARIGETDQAKPLVVTTNLGVDIPIGGDLKYVEHEGKALGASRQELQDIQTEMAAMGLAMLQAETRAAETAQAHRLDKSEQDSALAQAARGLQDCLETAFGFHAKYKQLQGSASIAVNMDFEGLALDAPTITAYSLLVDRQHLSLETMLTILLEKGALPDDFDLEEELARIESAGLATDQRSIDQAKAMAEVTATTNADAAA